MNSKSRHLGEIAAHAFAQQFNVVAWYPLVLDELERRARASDLRLPSGDRESKRA